MDQSDNIATSITQDIAARVILRNQYKDKRYYITADGRRAIWILHKPIEELISTPILVNLSLCYGAKKITIPEYTGKQHLRVEMSGIADERWEPKDPELIMALAPRNDATGRKRIMTDAVVLKVSVPSNLAELFRVLGEGNISAGVRLAGEIVAMRIK